MPIRFWPIDPGTTDTSKDNPECVESVKNKFGKSRKSNPEDTGFGVSRNPDWNKSWRSGFGGRLIDSQF
jgi:hypothetical protein